MKLILDENPKHVKIFNINSTLDCKVYGSEGRKCYALNMVEPSSESILL